MNTKRYIYGQMSKAFINYCPYCVIGHINKIYRTVIVYLLRQIF